MNRTLTNVFLRAGNALPSRGIRQICRSCSVIQRHPQPSQYHLLLSLSNTRPINITASVRYASTKLAKPATKSQTVKKPAAKKSAVNPRRSTAKKQRIKKKAVKKKEKKKLKRNGNKPQETIESVEALSLLREERRPKLTPSEHLREKRQSQELLERGRLRRIEGKRNKARNDGKTATNQLKTPISQRKLPSARKAGIRVVPEGIVAFL